jgi:hypothetical protein
MVKCFAATQVRTAPGDCECASAPHAVVDWCEQIEVQWFCTECNERLCGDCREHHPHNSLVRSDARC